MLKSLELSQSKYLLPSSRRNPSELAVRSSLLTSRSPARRLWLQVCTPHRSSRRSKCHQQSGFLALFHTSPQRDNKISTPIVNERCTKHRLLTRPFTSDFATCLRTKAAELSTDTYCSRSPSEAAVAPDLYSGSVLKTFKMSPTVRAPGSVVLNRRCR